MKRSKFDKSNGKVKEKENSLSTNPEETSIRGKYKAKSLLERSKLALKKYGAFENAFLSQEDSTDIQLGLSKMLADVRKKEEKEVQWESISTFSNIKEEKIINVKKYWILEFCTVFLNFLNSQKQGNLFRSLENPLEMKELIFLRLYKKLAYFNSINEIY
jgi:hypothetical protein